jgi:hypothetical protein
VFGNAKQLPMPELEHLFTCLCSVWITGETVLLQHINPKGNFGRETGHVRMMTVQPLLQLN